MRPAPASLAVMVLEWTGRHHSESGDFGDLSTHTVHYETEAACFVLAAGSLVDEASYTYKQLDDQVGVIIYQPNIWQGRTEVLLQAIFDFSDMTDRAVVTSNG